MKITTEKIMALNPCQNRLDNWLKHYSDFKGDVSKFFQLENITYNDKLWVALRLVSDETKVIFALDCAFSAAKSAAFAESAAFAAWSAESAAASAAWSAESAAASAAFAAWSAESAAKSAESAAASAAWSAESAAFAAWSAESAAKSAESAESAAVYKQEQENQLEVLLYLIKGE